MSRSFCVGRLTLMGIRLYNPATGRFASIDPVPGGNDNPYVYVTNPTDSFDLSGQCNWFRHFARCSREAFANNVVYGLISAAGGVLARAIALVVPGWGWLVGMVAGAIIQGGLNALHQWAQTGHVNAYQVIASAALGALAGSGATSWMSARMALRLKNTILSLAVYISNLIP